MVSTSENCKCHKNVTPKTRPPNPTIFGRLSTQSQSRLIVRKVARNQQLSVSFITAKSTVESSVKGLFTIEGVFGV